ncbi:class I tRNA ligase family protein [Candidatus Nomurabacteria bacterium]|nr:class I tRNA ligase family protein [Candidatus Nomurabacteria bacterium]
MDVKNRVMSFMYEIEKKYSNKNILIITHGGPAWLTFAGAKGYTANESLEMIRDKEDFHYMDNCEFAVLDFVPLPHNENYELDFHKPYIDEITLVSEDGEDMKRVKEVMDVWFDSGAMPFAQNHYPFENKDLAYPADFICEAIDQTRGWFYTLHAIGVLMGKGKAYKNVICLGHILDGNGKKMSKSLGNIVDPEIMINKYGVDTLRLWMYSVNQPGESKNFDEKTVALLHQQVFGLLYNVLAFYELYRDDESENSNPTVSSNVLDQWILTRLDELVVSSTTNLDNYKLLEPVRALRDFVDDLSTWYLRRSRDRIKNGDIYAKATLYFVLKTITKIMAPFAPFTAEDIWQKLKKQNDESSVHLSNWPELNEINNNVINEMKTVRQIVTAGLEARQKAGIKVRQPLGKLKIKNYTLKGEYNEILKDELNVKDIVVDDSIENLLEIDTHITLELRTEGNYRELVRAIQDMRKKQGLSPNDVIVLEIQTGIEGQEIISLFKDELLKTVGAKEIKLVENQGQEVKIEELLFSVNIVL